jgi:transposase
MTPEEENAILRAENAALREQVGQLRAEVAGLQQRLAKDSHNSSKPPSSDGVTRTTKSLRKKSGKRPGGQPGHRGHQVLLAETPDVVVVYRPDRCANCHQALPEDAPRWVERRQVQELPPVRLVVTEHQLVHVRCAACGATTAAAAPAGVAAPRQYGPRLRAVATYLVEQQFVPYARTRDVLAEVFGVPLAVGTLVNMVQAGAERLQPLAEEIRAALRHAPVLHHDETGLRVAKPAGEGAGLQWTHVTCTPRLTHYARHGARGATALEAIGILPACTGVSVHDGWTSYRHYTACRHALCNAHHLRALTFIEEELHQAWAGALKHLLREMHTAVEQARGAGAFRLERGVHDRFIARYEALLGQGLAQNPQPPPPTPPAGPRRRGRRKQSPVRNLLDRLWTDEHEVLAFLDDFAVPFDNNQAERDLRPVTVQQKISGTFRSERGADAFCCLRSILATWRKQGQSVLHVLESAFAGRSLSLPVPS